MRAPIIAVCVLLSGCASIVEGTTQELYVSVTPDNANCVANQKGIYAGRYDPKSMTMMIPKSRNPLEVRCAAPGYKDKTIRLVSEASAWGVTGALLLDFGIVDYSTGALNKYPGTLVIVMERQDATAR